MKSLETFDLHEWNVSISDAIRKKAVKALESGKILYFPSLAFHINSHEEQFYSPEKVDPARKNISYNVQNDQLAGTLYTGHAAEELKAMLKRYAITSRAFIDTLIPPYKQHLMQARTSYRPVEIAGRKSSYRKDDTRIHVDAFPATPTKGERILRFFTNINPHGKPRVWRVGEPFQDVVQKIAPQVSHPRSSVARLLQLLRITKGYRTAYDHYMLQIHDEMKRDMNYQHTAPQEEIHFPAGSSWMVYTDQVSHAAMAGQYVLEQTFHLPLQGIVDKSTTPLKILEHYFEKTLI